MQDDGNTKWLSYPELAEARGISKASAVRLARRRKWLKRHGNDGGVRVAVPEGEDQPKRDDPEDGREDNPRDDHEDNREDDLRDIRENISSITKAFDAAIATLREQLQAANTRADQERQRADQERERADRAETRLREAQEQLQATEQQRVEFWSRSRWQRIRAMWRGRRK